MSEKREVTDKQFTFAALSLMSLVIDAMMGVPLGTMLEEARVLNRESETKVPE